AAAGPGRRPSRPAPAAPAKRWWIRRARATLPSLRTTIAAIQFMRVGGGVPKKSAPALSLGAGAAGVRKGRESDSRPRPPPTWRPGEPKEDVGRASPACSAPTSAEPPEQAHKGATDETAAQAHHRTLPLLPEGVGRLAARPAGPR